MIIEKCKCEEPLPADQFNEKKRAEGNQETKSMKIC
jgi:hypothetical protein